jgi:hypothetical protein
VRLLRLRPMCGHLGCCQLWLLAQPTSEQLLCMLVASCIQGWN